jgi:trimethylamine--corrinoid protein Co-methyltransferase
MAINAKDPDTAPCPGKTGRFDDTRLERIHTAGLQLIEQVGLSVGSEKLLALCKTRGLKTVGPQVCFTPKQVETALATVPDRFVLHARNPRHSVTFSLEESILGLGRSAAFVMTPDGCRRPATAQDFISFLKLGQQLPAIQMMGNLVTPSDLPADRVFSFMMAAQIHYTDKPYILLHPADLELLCAAFGIARNALGDACDRGQAYGQSTVNTISPLELGGEQGDLLLAMAEHGIPICLSPSPAMGSSSPCTVAGTLAINHSEVLAGLTLCQMIRPGLPVLYGTLPGGSDMRTMGATYGSAEARLLETGAARLAKGLGLLTRGNVGLTESFDCDFQAGAEAMFNFVTALQNKINYLPGCGILASFAAASKEKLLLDAELAATARRFMRPWSATDADIAEAVIALAGPRGSFLTHPHTLARCRTEIHHPKLLCRSSYDNWVGQNLVQRATAEANRLIESYAPPLMDADLEQVLERHLSFDNRISHVPIKNP